ncbi:Gfo/Idh/MocA family oxidoreductase [Kineosporia mesophila]|uniref:Gfo/Idh/MocA family oxidoreductase n=1 Tax=Kineosporia mesophila TaxID=566012 RepID=A0ABP6ZAT3_9ACTN|nr:Gfo/Idh/MocA family oxidoreductase [Kineosporia mesophila]
MTARVVVVGGGFGRIHARAVASRPDRYQFAGVAGRGGAASRELAAVHGVPYFDLTDGCDEAAEAADVACVAVGSAISGGDGSAVAQNFLARKVPVLQEHPLHPDELLACARVAREHGVQHRMNLHYRHVRPVRVFIDAARRLAQRSEILFVDAASPVHVLHPLIDILAAALGGVRPWSWKDVAGSGPLRSVTGTFAGVPVTLRVQNQLDPLDRDNQALLWHRIAVGTSAGVLTLADTHGPVLWSPRWHADRDEHRRLVTEGPGAQRLGQSSTTVLPGTDAVAMAEVLADRWPEAVDQALSGLLAAEGSDPLRQAQLDLSTARIWNDVTTHLGPPERITARAPVKVAISELMDDVVADESASGQQEVAASGYSVEAEFYDLIAGRRTTSASEVVKALAGIRPEDGPVVEIGAGTGILTMAVAKAWPGVRIIAAEPDPLMRAVLTSKVVRDADLRERVSVTDGSAPDLELPERIGAALVCGVAGHLEPEARQTLWRRLKERIVPGGPLVVELLSVTAGARFSDLRLGQARIGQDDVQWSLSVAPGRNGASLMTSSWQVSREGSVHRSESAHHVWRPTSLRDIAAEADLPLVTLVEGGTEGAVPLGVLRSPPDPATSSSL